MLSAIPAGSAAEPPKAPPVADPGAVALMGRYRGTLPCADCSGIRTELVLYREAAIGAPAAYALRETFLGLGTGERTVESVGKWRIVEGTPSDPEATVYQIAFDRPERVRSFLRVDARTLRLLDRSLAEIESGATHDLVRDDAGEVTSAPGSPVAPGASPQPARGDTPRKAITGYLLAARSGDDEKAATFLDLAAVPEADRATQGPLLARHLKIVLDQTLWFGDLDEISDDPRGRLDDGLPEDRERAGAIHTSEGSVDIRLRRVQEADGTAVWKFGPGTVERIPRLYDEFGIGAAGDLLPRWAYSTRFGEVELWQWIGFPVILLAAIALGWLLTPLVVRVLTSGARRTRTETDDRLLVASVRPLHAFLTLLLSVAGIEVLHLSIPAARVVGDILRVLFILVATWWVLQSIDALAESARLRLIAGGRAGAIGAVILTSRLVKVAVCLLALVVLLQQTNFRVSGLLAGLGVGGLAAGLGAQRTVANLLGGITLAMDQAFRVGDLCRVADVVGTIEEIGFRSTRLRTLERTLVTIPNAQMSDARIENFSMRDTIRLFATLGLAGNTTPARVQTVVSGVRELLAGHPRVSRGNSRVRLVGVGDGTLYVEVMAYITTSEPNEFMAIREEILMRVVEIVESSGAVLATPTVVVRGQLP